MGYTKQLSFETTALMAINFTNLQDCTRLGSIAKTSNKYTVLMFCDAALILLLCCCYANVPGLVPHAQQPTVLQGHIFICKHL